MFAQGGMYNAAVEQDFRGIRDAVEGLQCFFKLVIIVVA